MVLNGRRARKREKENKYLERAKCKGDRASTGKCHFLLNNSQSREETKTKKKKERDTQRRFSSRINEKTQRKVNYLYENLVT